MILFMNNIDLSFIERILRLFFPKYRADKALISAGTLLLIAANAAQWAFLASINLENATIQANSVDSSPIVPNIVGIMLIAAGVFLYVKKEASPHCDFEELYSEDKPLRKQRLFNKVYGVKAPVSLINFILSHDNGEEIIEKYKSCNYSVNFQDGIFTEAFELEKRYWRLLISLILIAIAFVYSIFNFAVGNSQDALSALMFILTLLPISYVFFQENARKFSQKWLIELTSEQKKQDEEQTK